MRTAWTIWLRLPESTVLASQRSKGVHLVMQRKHICDALLTLWLLFHRHVAARKKLGPINIPSPIKKFMGRRKLVSDAIVTKLRLQNQVANLAGASVSSRVMTSQIEIERRLELGPGANIDALTPLSRTIALRYVALIAPVAI